MGPGGTRFTGPARPRPTPRVIDVEGRPKQEPLYDVLAVAPMASSREIRKVARALRRNLPDSMALHDVCLAEQVLGRAELRGEYDTLLGRLRAANQPIPNIGAAIEGVRLGPSFATRMGSAGRASARVAGRLFVRLVQVILVILVIVVIAVIAASFETRGGKHTTNEYKSREFEPSVHPKIDLDPKLFEFKPIVIPKFDPTQLDLPPYKPLPHTAPKPPLRPTATPP